MNVSLPPPASVLPRVRGRHRLEDAAVRGLAMGVRWLPMPVVRAAGRAIGRLAYRVDRRHRRTALENLAHAFPERTPRERRAIARDTFGHFGSVILELLKLGQLPAERMLDLVEVEGAGRASDARARGRGILFFTGHFGYWEVQAIVHALRDRPVSVLARPLDNPLLHARLERIRTLTGNRVIYRQGALRRLLRAIAANEGVALLIDQHLVTPDAVHVRFFGRPAATTAALAAVALRTGAVVIPVFALPLPHGRYRLVYEPPIEPPGDGDSPDAIEAFTQRCTDVLEAWVRRDPHLWLWMHRRWRS